MEFNILKEKLLIKVNACKITVLDPKKFDKSIICISDSNVYDVIAAKTNESCIAYTLRYTEGSNNISIHFDNEIEDIKNDLIIEMNANGETYATQIIKPKKIESLNLEDWIFKVLRHDHGLITVNDLLKADEEEWITTFAEEKREKVSEIVNQALSRA